MHLQSTLGQGSTFYFAIRLPLSDAQDPALAAGAAHIKTGMVADVRAIAGYVIASSGRRYVIVAIINDPSARGAQRAHDALLDWLQKNG